LFFVSPDNIDTGTPLGQKIRSLIKNDIAVYAAHTNLDAAPRGVNYWLAKKEGLDPDKCEVIEPTYTEELCKLAVFVPKTHIEKVREAICEAGPQHLTGWGKAGHIGNYSHCTFNIEGIGTFKPLCGADPYIGKKGKLEKVAEVRLETIVPKQILDEVIKAMLQAHPYEEVAYDVYPLLNKGKEYGLGLVGELAPTKVSGLKSSRVIGGKKVKRLAVCSGGGGKLIEKAYTTGAQAIIMGECSYHDELLAQDLGILLVKKGHFATENVVIKPLAKELGRYLPQLKIMTI